MLRYFHFYGPWTDSCGRAAMSTFRFKTLSFVSGVGLSRLRGRVLSLFLFLRRTSNEVSSKLWGKSAFSSKHCPTRKKKWRRPYQRFSVLCHGVPKSWYCCCVVNRFFSHAGNDRLWSAFSEVSHRHISTLDAHTTQLHCIPYAFRTCLAGPSYSASKEGLLSSIGESTSRTWKKRVRSDFAWLYVNDQECSIMKKKREVALLVK